MSDQTLILAAALMLALIAVAFAAYERGSRNGARAERRAHQCADEMRLVAQARGRHPSSLTLPVDPPAYHLPPVAAVERSAGANPDPWLP